MKIVCKTRIVEPERKVLRLGIEVTAEENAYGVFVADCAEGCEAVTADWGDGCVEALPGMRSVAHAYDVPGRREVRLSDDVGALQLCAPMPGNKFNYLYPKRLRTVEINSVRLVTFKNYAFAQCVNLETVKVRTAASLTLPNYCFKNCTALHHVELPSVTDIADIGTDNELPFYGCAAELEIHFARANEAAIRATAVFGKYPTLGAERAVVKFDM